MCNQERRSKLCFVFKQKHRKHNGQIDYCLADSSSINPSVSPLRPILIHFDRLIKCGDGIYILNITV